MRSQILRICDSCVFYNSDLGTCKAFPDGIPLKSTDTHFEPIEGQVGTTVYELDQGLYDYFDLYRRIHPEVRFPVIISYEIPEEGDSMVPVQEELEEDSGS